MEDEDGTCLLDVLCDPQALNDFLHGTKEPPFMLFFKGLDSPRTTTEQLLSGDLLINSSSGEPSLFTDTPSPVSLLADDSGSHDMPISGCVDLSFLDEALLASPAGEDSEEVQDDPKVQSEVAQQQEEEEETCDILQQSLQEADITEHTLALEAGLAQSGESLSIYPSGMSSTSPTYMAKPMSISGVTTLPRDTQIAVEPPQPSLLAVGPGCPSLKPAAPQLMGLLPGNVFPAPPSEASFSLSRAQGSGMIIHKTLPGITLSPAVRTTAPPEIILQRTPLPIQPKMAVSIQPRLVQISPKPSDQKSSPGLAFIPPATSQNILLSSPVSSRQPIPSPSTATLNKPVSLQLVNQGGSIVIQPQGLFQGQSHFILPSQSSVTQSASAVRPLLSTTSNQIPSGAPLAGQLVDGSQIVTVRPRQLNFSPVFTTPTGQLTLRQGTLLSGPVQLQSAPPTVFQMPAQLTGAYPPQAQGQHGGVVLSPSLGKQITLINSSGVLAPDMTSISIVNGPSVVQSLPFLSQAQRPLAGGPEEQLSLPQTPVLLLPERAAADKKEANEHLQSILQQCTVSPPAPAQPTVAQIHTQPSPVITLLQTPPQSTLATEPGALLSKNLPKTAEGGHTPLNEVFTHHAVQEASAGSLDSHISPAVSESGASPTALVVCPPSEVLSVLSQCGGIPTPVHSGSEHGDMLASPPLPQYSGSTPSTLFPTPPLSDRQLMAPSAFVVQTANMHLNEESVLCMSPSSTPEKTFASENQHLPIHVSTTIGGTLESGLNEAQQHMQQMQQTKFGDRGLAAESEVILLDLQENHEVLTSQDAQIQALIQVPSVSVKTSKRLTPAMRQHRVQQQLYSDHNAVLNPHTYSQFVSLEDAVRNLLPYNTCSRALPSQADLISVDKQFENASSLLLKHTTDMLNKYRQLLLTETQQESPSAEMVMLERLFLQSERFLLSEERRRARGDPDSFLMTLCKASLHRSMLPSCQADSSTSPPSPPAWALHSDRPPGLKTYRSRSRGALRLTIKQESGSRKVVHNSACDEPQAPTGHKRNSDGHLINGEENRHEKQETLNPPLLSPTETSLERKAAVRRSHTVMDKNRTACESIEKSEHKFDSTAGLLPGLHPTESKRTKMDISDALVDESGLSEHLQSAIDSILELQRLQGPATHLKPKLQPSSALEQDISCVLEGEL